MKVFILGASGWIGSYLVPAFKKLDVSLAGSYFGNRENTGNIEAFKFDMKDFPCLEDHLGGYKPDVIVNLLYSDEYQLLLETHKQISDFSQRRGIRYVYASSALAVESGNGFHNEAEPGNATGRYGRLKSDSESYLARHHDNFAAFRFSATHGFSACGQKRTNIFYDRLKRGEIIKVDTGILQNRSFVGDLADMMAVVSLNDTIQGICHLGAQDYSDEFVFRKKLAVAFGFDKDQVIPGDHKDVNVVVTPHKIYEYFEERFKFSEDEAIAKIAAQKNLFEACAVSGNGIIT